MESMQAARLCRRRAVRRMLISRTRNALIRFFSEIEKKDDGKLTPARVFFWSYFYSAAKIRASANSAALVNSLIVVYSCRE